MFLSFMMMNPKRLNIIPYVFAAALSICVAPYAKAQTNVETFGQNRIQYRKFDWKFFETKHFKIYHYDAAGRQLARYVSEQVENDIGIIERKLGGEFPGRMNIVVYNSYDDYRQTNIGRKYDSQIQDIPAGTVDLVGDKLVVYFTGVHTDIRRQTRNGMARVVMERMMFGENFREMVKNAVLMNLPPWTVNGFISYLIDGWDSKSNSDWKNLIAARPKAGFNELAEAQPELAGKAFWKYISDKYGEGNMRTMLYNMQSKGSLNQGIKTSLGYNVKKAYDSVMYFYKDVYAMDELRQEKPDSASALIEIKIPNDNSTIRNIKVAPKGNDVAYVAWKNGEYRVYIQKTKDQEERSVILEGGKQDYNEQPDPDYPLLAWSNNGYKLAILFRKGTETRLRIYNSTKARIENYVIPKNRFDRVLGISFAEEEDRLIFSAIKKSQTDLYEFVIKGSRMKNITNDAWDDVQPWYVSGGSRRGILFLSNRPEANLDVPIEVNELPTGPMNVFFYNTKTQRRELVQMSNVTNGTVSQPIQYGSDNYAYLYDVNGVRNQYVVLMGRDKRNMDSAYAVPITNYPSNVVSHQYNPASNQVAHVVQEGNKYKVYFTELKIPGVNTQQKELLPTLLLESEMNKKSSSVNLGLSNPNATISSSSNVNTQQQNNEEPLLKSGNVFQSEFANEPTNNTANANVAPENATTSTISTVDGSVVATPADVVDSAYIKMKAQPYRLGFRPDFFTVRVDNSVLFNRYQSVKQTGGSYSNPPLGGMITVSLDDVMENHRFTGGFRLPINFSGSTYFLQYENFTRRVDWGLMYLRSGNYYNYLVTYVDSRGIPVFNNEQLGKTTTTILQGSASYPFDRIRSIRMHLGFREDKLNFKAQDSLSLKYEPEDRKQYYALSRMEYVFDNTIKPTLNIYNGFRYKLFAEYMYRLNNPNGGFYNLGIDARYYKKIYKNFIWAFRAAGAHSGGNQKILYFLGGVDNWINSKYSDYVPVRPTQNYAFQTLATNLRGYEQNSRNGNTYAVANMELRLPVLTTFVKRPIQSGILKNLQAVGFLDVGSAWNGLLPSADELRNNTYLPSPGSGDPNPVTLEISDATGGVGIGYGGGLRTMLFGYFLRADAAWNIDGRKKPLIYISIGTDF
jgi:hypothetical protein